MHPVIAMLCLGLASSTTTVAAPPGVPVAPPTSTGRATPAPHPPVTAVPRYQATVLRAKPAGCHLRSISPDGRHTVLNCVAGGGEESQVDLDGQRRPLALRADGVDYELDKVIDVNDAGWVVGAVRDPAGTPQDRVRAARWSPTGDLSVLHLPVAGAGTAAYTSYQVSNIDGEGNVVVRRSVTRTSVDSYLWPRDAAPQQIPAPGRLSLWGRALSDTGIAVGFHSVPSSRPDWGAVPFSWTGDGGRTDLPRVQARWGAAATVVSRNGRHIRGWSWADDNRLVQRPASFDGAATFLPPASGHDHWDVVAVDDDGTTLGESRHDPTCAVVSTGEHTACLMDITSGLPRGLTSLRAVGFLTGGRIAVEVGHPFGDTVMVLTRAAAERRPRGAGPLPRPIRGAAAAPMGTASE